MLSTFINSLIATEGVKYFIGSIKNHGLIKGLFFGFKRLSSCHPIKVLGAKEGFDPVKKKGS